MHTQTKFTPFLRAYIATALWSSTLDNGDPMDADYSLSDLADSTLGRMAEDCVRFQTENALTLTNAAAAREDFATYDQAAHDFWLTRNGHGAGFFDGDWPEPFATKLTGAAHAFGSCDLYVGDDGKIYAQ